MEEATPGPAGLDIHDLRMLKAIGDAGSITAAAASLGLSQPAVSQKLQRLERRLGVAVIARAGRSVRLTEAGEVLARHAAAATSALDAAAGELAELRGLGAGRVRVVGFPSASPTVIPRLLARMAELHPGIDVTYAEEEPPAAVDAVRADRADIALTFSYPGDRSDPHGRSAHGLIVHAVGRDDLHLVLPRDHALASREVVELAELAEERWIAGCPRCRGHLMEMCARAGFEPEIAFETDNVVAVESLVAQGIGVATLPAMAVGSFPRLPDVVTRPLPRDAARVIHVVHSRGADRVPAIRVTLDAIADIVADPHKSGSEDPRP